MVSILISGVPKNDFEDFVKAIMKQGYIVYKKYKENVNIGITYWEENEHYVLKHIKRRKT